MANARVPTAEKIARLVEKMFPAPTNDNLQKADVRATRSRGGVLLTTTGLRITNGQHRDMMLLLRRRKDEAEEIRRQVAEERGGDGPGGIYAPTGRG